MTRDTLIFFAILLAILLVVFAIIFFVIKAIIRFIISLFKKKQKPHVMEGGISDKGEDLGVYVEELEKSKAERAKAEALKQPTATAPMPQGGQPIKQIKQETQPDKEKEFAEKNQKDIESGLNKLKGTGDESEEGSLVGEKVKIPTAKDFSSTMRGVEEQKDDNKNQIEVPSKVIPGKTAIVQTDRMAGLQKDDVKINRIKLPPKLEAMAKARASGGPVEQSQGSGSKIEDNFFEKPAVIKDSIISKAKPKTQSNNDASIFGGKEELSRSDLRQELRNDSKVWKAQREAGLNLSPVERTKLEKQVFSQTYGGNISKSDFRAGIKKLNQKLIGVKNQTEHAKIRKEIKFLKKIGGIK